MGKKKGKNTQQQQKERAGDSIVDVGSEKIKEGGPKGKKSKRKQYDEDAIDDDLLEIANEQPPGAEGKQQGLEEQPTDIAPSQLPTTNIEEPNVKENVSPTVDSGTSGTSGTSGSKNKKGKKKKSKRNDDWEDDVAEELERLTINEDKGPVNESQLTTETQSSATKAEKKTAKKEKEMNNSKQEDKKQNTDLPPPPSADTPPRVSEPTSAAATGGNTDDESNKVDNDDGDGENDEGDDGKKKKKKKKKKDEEKKGSAKPKKKAAGLLKMKEEIEALRNAQKKREEEELERQRKAEEEERLRLEKIQLEKERKEKKKQKEKERKERLRKEGKLLSKSEKEKRARQAIQMAALIEQGLVIPQQKAGTIEGEKKPIRYGSRPKNKKKFNSDQGLESRVETDDSATALTDESVVTASELDDVKDNWDDDDDDVKDNWDDEDEDDEQEDADEEDMEQEDTAAAATTAASQPEPSVPHPSTTTSENVEDSTDDASSDDDSADDSDDEDMTPYEKASKRIHERRQRHAAERSPELLRSPVVCVLGHVDTGKTKILDKIRHTNVQDGEAGGITQQIGATFVPEDAIKEQTKCLKEFSKADLKVPGLLIIDTPGHESFSNLRTRGSSMCDIAILVVDIMHGLEPQTIESLQLLRKGKVPFVVALNKIDRLFDWRRNPTSGVRDTLKRQKPNTKLEFDDRVKETVTQFAEQGLNAALFWDKVDFTEYIHLVPTSAISGDGMADLISQIILYSEKFLEEKLMFSKEVEAIVLEVKVIAGLGTTVDIILRNGLLHESDTMVLTGIDGPFVTQARALLMPQPLRELRVKNAYVNHKTVIASQGVKICGRDLEKTMAGTPVLIAKKEDEIEVLKNEASAMMSGALSSIKLKEKGVFVQASTLGSLEALLEFLKTSKIPYAGVNIGPVHRKDVMKASVMLERDNQWACILAFDVRVERDAQEMADSLGVKIFTADIIYHLFDNFMNYREKLKDEGRRRNEHIATFPCKLRILPDCVFNARNPIIVGVVIEAGILKPGTPLCVPSKEFVNIGTVTSLESNHKSVDIAHKGEEVCIKVESLPGEAPKLYGRHFTLDDQLVSKISRDSINAVKTYFRDDLQKSDWQLMIELKKLFKIY